MSEVSMSAVVGKGVLIFLQLVPGATMEHPLNFGVPHVTQTCALNAMG